MIEPFRAYVDESLRLPARLYLMAAVFVDGDRAESHRAVLRGLLRKRQRRLHWRDEDDQRRAVLIAAVAELRPRGIVVGEGLNPRHQERARRKCMERLVWELGHRAIPEAVIECRNGELDRRDQRMIDALAGKHALPPGLRVRWQSPEVEPLLWLADIVAGAASLAEAGQEAQWKELGNGLAVHRFDLN